MVSTSFHYPTPYPAFVLFMKPENPSFHAHHAPMGALASFTCGSARRCWRNGPRVDGAFPGAIVVGYQTPDGALHRLPFFESQAKSEADRYRGESGGDAKADDAHIGTVEREFQWATDRMSLPEMDFTVFTPCGSLPDPESASTADLRFARCPSVPAQVTFRNTTSEDWRGFFGLGIEQRWSLLGPAAGAGLVGAMSQDTIGFASNTPGAETFIDFSIEEALAPDSVRGIFCSGKSPGC